MERVKVAKLSRALGVALTTKAARIMEKRPTKPGQHGKGRRPTQSNFGKQLLEKQRLKAQYNVTEKQLRTYFDKAFKLKGSTGTNFLRLLESRLDMVAYRAGFAPTIYAARQLVNHGHLLVNGKKVTKPGFAVRIGSVVSAAEKSKKHPSIEKNFGSSIVPPYIAIKKEDQSATLNYLPERNEIAVICEEHLVVEFYSR